MFEIHIINFCHSTDGFPQMVSGGIEAPLTWLQFLRRRLQCFRKRLSKNLLLFPLLSALIYFYIPIDSKIFSIAVDFIVFPNIIDQKFVFITIHFIFFPLPSIAKNNQLNIYYKWFERLIRYYRLQHFVSITIGFKNFFRYNRLQKLSILESVLNYFCHQNRFSSIPPEPQKADLGRESATFLVFTRFFLTITMD